MKTTAATPEMVKDEREDEVHASIHERASNPSIVKNAARGPSANEIATKGMRSNGAGDRR